MQTTTRPSSEVNSEGTEFMMKHPARIQTCSCFIFSAAEGERSSEVALVFLGSASEVKYVPRLLLPPRSAFLCTRRHVQTRAEAKPRPGKSGRDPRCLPLPGMPSSQVPSPSTQSHTDSSQVPTRSTQPPASDSTRPPARALRPDEEQSWSAHDRIRWRGQSFMPRGRAGWICRLRSTSGDVGPSLSFP
jgi:hypothetical protein